MILRINVTEKYFQIFEKIDTIENSQIFNEKEKKKKNSIDKFYHDKEKNFRNRSTDRSKIV